MPLRNVALTAMEIATLPGCSPTGCAGVGHGVQDWMAQVGARVESPMTLLREHVAAVRALLRGERVRATGATCSSTRSPSTGRRRPARRCWSARAARDARLAGEVADGVLLDSVTGPDVVRRGRALVDDGRQSAGRAGRAQVTVYTELDPTEPAATLTRQVDERVGVLIDAGADTVVLQATDEEPNPMPLVEALMASGLL